jgi:hypothetical protein
MKCEARGSAGREEARGERKRGARGGARREEARGERKVFGVEPEVSAVSRSLHLYSVVETAVLSRGNID